MKTTREKGNEEIWREHLSGRCRMYHMKQYCQIWCPPKKEQQQIKFWLSHIFLLHWNIKQRFLFGHPSLVHVSRRLLATLTWNKTFTVPRTKTLDLPYVVMYEERRGRRTEIAERPEFEMSPASARRKRHDDHDEPWNLTFWGAKRETTTIGLNWGCPLFLPHWHSRLST